MKKNVITVLCIAVFLFMGAAFLPQSAGALWMMGNTHMCVVPYNIKTGSWNTGLHIKSVNSEEQFWIEIWSDGEYADKIVYLDMDLHRQGWTGTIQQLFDLPWAVMEKETSEASPLVAPVLSSPVTLWIYSSYGRFMVSQFIFYGTIGYGFQTIYSWPEGSWPNPDSSSVIISRPPSDSTEGSRSAAPRDRSPVE